MLEAEQKTELQINDYLEGRLSGTDRERFEARMKENEELRRKVETTTQSVELLRRTLTKLEPGSDFEDRVSSQIIQITQSNQMLPAFANEKGKGKLENRQGPLTASDPDAGLLDDPEAVREKRRLMILAAVSAVLFAGAIITIGMLLMS